MSKRPISTANGFVQDIDTVASLSDGQTNIRLLSDRSLYILQNLSGLDITFLSRYGTILPDDEYIPVEPGSSDAGTVEEAVNIIRRDLTDMTIEDTLQCICDALNDIAVGVQNSAQVSCGACGSEVDPPPESTPPVGPGEPWPDWPAYDDYKCKAANWLVDGQIDLFQKLLVYDVDFWTTTTVSAGAGLVTSILLTTLLGGWVVVVAGAVISLVTALIAGTLIDLTDIKNVLLSYDQELTCALYNGSDAETSREAFLSVLTAQGLNSAEVGLVELIMVNSLVNQLYQYNDVIDAYTPTRVCTGCGADPCPFFFNKGSGVITYDGSTFVLTSEAVASYHSINISSPYADVGCTGGNWQVVFVSTTITIPDGTHNRQVWCWDSPTTLLSEQYKPDFPPLDTPLSMMAMEMNSSAGPFTITMKITGKCGLCVSGPEGGCT